MTRKRGGSALSSARNPGESDLRWDVVIGRPKRGKRNQGRGRVGASSAQFGVRGRLKTKERLQELQGVTSHRRRVLFGGNVAQ